MKVKETWKNSGCGERRGRGGTKEEGAAEG
jgi:hypothetical protein